MPNRIDFQVGLNLDKNSFSQIRAELEKIQKLTTVSFQEMNKGKLDFDFNDATEQLVEMKGRAVEIQRALEKAFNTKIGTLNVSTFTKELQKSHLDIKQMQEDFQYLGPSGQAAFRQIAMGMTSFHSEAKQTSKILDEFGKSLSNTIKWGISSSIFNNITNSLQKAWDFSVKLDSSLNDIRIVTNKSAEDIEKFAVSANKAAKNLGASTRDYTEASLIYYQQGLSDEEVQARTDVTLKTANVTQQSAADVSEQLTAIWNGYKVTAEEAELYIDKVAAVAASTAADLEEMATGMSKVASAAATVGIPIDDLNAMMATMVSVTREAPETIGTSLRSMFARMGDLAVDGVDEFGVSLGKVSGLLESVGVEILDSQGQMRGMNDIITDLAEKWKGWTQAQRQSVAVAVAGKQQYSRLIALLDNWDMEQEALNTSIGAAGTLQEQQNIYLDSTKAHLQELSTAWERVENAFIDNKSFNGLIDNFTTLIDGLGNFVEALGGGGKALSTFGAIALNVFGNTITKELDTFVSKIRSSKKNTEELDAITRNLKGFKNLDSSDKVTQDIVKMNGLIVKNADLIDEEQKSTIKTLEEEYIKVAQVKDEWEATKQKALDYINAIAGTDFKDYKELAPENIKEHSEKTTENNDEANVALMNAKSDWKDAREYLDRFEKGTDKQLLKLDKNTIAQLKNIKKNMQDIGKSGEVLQGTLVKMGKPSEKLSSALKTVKKDLTELNKQKRNKALENFLGDPKNVAKFREDFQKLSVIMKEDLGTVEQATQQAMGIMEQEFDGVRTKTEQIDDDVKRMGEDLNNAGNNIKQIDMTASFVNLAGAIANTASAISTLGNIPKIFTDEDLSTGEKFLQIIMALSTSIPMLYSGVSTGLDSISTFKDKIIEVALAREKQTVADIAATVSQKALDIAQDAVGTSGQKVATNASLAAGGEALEGEAAAGATPSVGALAAATWSLLAPLLAIVAVVGVVAAGIYALVKAYNADADAAKQAAEDAKNQKEIYESLKSKYEELKKTLEDYKDSRKAIDEMKKGTEEWNEAVTSLNEKVIELMNTYPMLSKYITNENGVLTISKEGQEELEKQQSQKVAANYRGMVGSQIYANEAQNKSDLTDLGREFTYLTGTGGSATGTSNLSGETMQKIIDAYSDNANLFNATDKEANAQLEEILKDATLGDPLQIELLKKQIRDASDEIIKVKTSIDNNTEANKLLKQEYTRSYLQEKGGEKFQESKYQGIISAAVNNVKVDENAINDLYEDEFKDKWGGKSDEDIQKMYAEKKGYTWKSNDWGNKGTYEIDGVTKQISDEEARKELARMEYYEQHPEIQQSGEQFAEKLDNFEKRMTEITGMSSEDAATFTASMGKGGKIDFSKMTKEQVDAFEEWMKSNEWQQYYQAFGYNWGHSYDEASKALENDENAGGSTEKIISAISEYRENPNIEAYYTQSEKYQQNAQNIQATSDILSKGDLSELSEEQLKLLDELEGKYEELSEIQDRTSHEYLHTLREIEEQEETNAMESLESAKELSENQVADLFQKLHDVREGTLKVDNVDEEVAKITQQIEEAMDKLSETDYKIQVQLEADLASDVDEAFGIADELGNLKDLVHDDLTYTFEEAQTLIEQGYGEMFTNAQETAENTIKVNKDVLNAYIDDKQQEIETDRQAKIKQLEEQRELLNAQKTALTSKLSALQEALGAETEADAQVALAKVQNSEKEYQSATEALNEKLKNEAEGATNDAKINEELYNQLGGMYDTDKENQADAEKAATDNQAENIDTRIENVRKLYNAYVSLGKAVSQSATGEVTAPFVAGVTQGGTNATGGKSEEVKHEEIKADEVEEKPLDLSKLFENDKPTEEYKATIQALIDATNAQINSIDAQIGSVDAGIAALKSADLTLDKTQAGAGTGKGSGSGGKDSKDPKEIERLEEEADRYHVIDQEIQQINNDLDKLQKEQEKLFGQALLDNINKQLKDLDKQIDNYNKKIKIANKEASDLRTKLSLQGVQFDVDGNILNYVEAFNAQLAYVNGIIDQYNNMSADEQENFEGVVDSAKEAFEQFQTNIDRYDDLIVNTIPELESNIQDAIDQQVELQVEKFNMEIEIRLDLAQAERDWNQFKKKIIDGIKDDDILGNAQARLKDFYSYYKEDRTGVIQRNTEHVNSILEELQKIDAGETSSVYGDNKNKALDDLKTYYEQLMQDLEDIVDIQEEIHQAYLDMIDEAAEAFEEQLGTYEQITDIIEHDKNIIQMVYGENDYQDMVQYFDMQEENNNKQLDFQRQQVEFWKQQMDNTEKNSEEWKKAKENWMDAVSELNSSIEESIENLQDKYTNAINLIFQNLNNQVTGGLGLEYVTEEWELINKNSDQYLDNINRLYGIRDLANKYQDAIDDTDNIAAQQKLKKLMDEEVKALREKDKLTQYDVERAEKKYQIALKQIALEEAQQAKTSMRLRRDSQGNYTYQFTTDDDAVGKAQDELAALQNELYNFDLEHYRNNMDQMLDIYTEYTEKMAEAAQILDPEERAQREQLIQEQYGELINGIVEQNLTLRNNLYESGFTELSQLYEDDKLNFQDMTDTEKQKLVEEMIPQWQSGVNTMIEAFVGNDEGEGGFLPTVKGAWEEMQQATKNYEDSLKILQSNAGQYFGDIQKGIDPLYTSTKKLVTENDKLIQQWKDGVGKAAALVKEIDSLTKTYDANAAAAKNATEKAYNYWAEQQRQAAKAAQDEEDKRKKEQEEKDKANKAKAQQAAAAPAQNTQAAPATGSNNADKAEGVAAAIWILGGNASGWYNGSDRFSRLAEKFGNKDVVQNIINAQGPNGELTKKWINKRQDLKDKYSYGRFNTGGYTGDWLGNVGKFAMLDKKELVLNKTDTSNILAATEVMREITNSVRTRSQDLLSAVQAQGAGIAANDQTLEQNVHIEASFPNVQNHTEIETAFNNLVNIASQRAMRRNK